MKKILIIGIAAGNPEYVIIQAVNALNQVDIFFIMEKGASKAKLVELRKEICRRYVEGNDYRFVEAGSPAWTRHTEDYRSTIDDLNRDKQAVFERLIAEEMADGECGAFLVWGDPRREGRMGGSWIATSCEKAAMTGCRTRPKQRATEYSQAASHGSWDGPEGVWAIFDQVRQTA